MIAHGWVALLPLVAGLVATAIPIVALALSGMGSGTPAPRVPVLARRAGGRSRSLPTTSQVEAVFERSVKQVGSAEPSC